MHYCYDCETIFDEPERYYDQEGEITWQGTYYSGCPHCGGYYDEVFECENCGELKSKEDMYDEYICNYCYEEEEID